MTSIKRNRSTVFLALALTVAFVLVCCFFESRHLNGGDPASQSAAQSGTIPSADIDSHRSNVALAGRGKAEAGGSIQATSLPRGATVMGHVLIENAEFACKRRGIRLIAISEARARDVQATNASISDLYASLTDHKDSIIDGRVALDGRVTFPEIPFGMYGVDVYCDEYQFVRGPKIIEARAPGGEPYEWVFNVGLRLEVSVIDASGSPVHNASIYLDRQDQQSGDIGSARAEHPLYRAAFADQNGRHTFNGLDGGQYRLVVKTTHSLEQESHDVVKEIRLSDRQDLHEVRLTVPMSGRIEINVRSSNGLPVDGLVFYAHNDKDSTVRRSTTQQNGRYLISPVPWGEHQLSYSHLSAPAITFQIPGRELVAVKSSQPTIIDIELETNLGFIEGRVVDESGQPIAGAVVQVIPSVEDMIDRNNFSAQLLQDPPALEHMSFDHLVTDRSGYFKIEKLAAHRKYQLEARHGSAGILRSETVVPGRFVEIVFPLGASIGGRVMQGDGTAVNNFVVVVSSRTTGLRTSQAFSSQNGEFLIDGVVPGSLHLSVVGVDTELVGTQTVELFAGQQLTGVTITLSDRK